MAVLAGLLGRNGLAVAVVGVLVLLLPAHAVLLGHDLPGESHVHVLEGAPQAVPDDAVHQVLVAELHAAEHRAVHIAHAADRHAGHALEKDVETDERRNGVIDERGQQSCRAQY